MKQPLIKEIAYVLWKTHYNLYLQHKKQPVSRTKMAEKGARGRLPQDLRILRALEHPITQGAKGASKSKTNSCFLKLIYRS